VPAEQVFIGLTTSGLCAFGIAQEEWFLRETRKGRWLVRLCGTRNAVWVLRALLALGVAFGLALASGFVNPIRWSATTMGPSHPSIEAHRRIWHTVHEPRGRRLEACG
jgi:hypothetical protein